MPTPDPEEFARRVLWHLAALRSDVLEINLRLAELAEHLTGAPESEASRLTSATRNQALQWKLYRDACREVGLEPKPPGDSTPPPGAAL